MKKVLLMFAVLAIALAGCNSNKVDVSKLKPVTTHKVGDLSVVLMNDTGDFKQGQNEFVVQFQNQQGQAVDVGDVQLGSSMSMPSMAPMSGDSEITPTGQTGTYRVKSNFAMSGAASSFLDTQNGVTEADLVTRALASNPSLAAERYEIEMDEGGVAQARLHKNPSLSVGGLKEVNGDDNRFSIGASIPLELFGRRARRTEVAVRKLDSTRDTIADRERLLAGEVRMRFGEALAAVRNLAFTEQLLQANRDFLKLMEDRVREGAAASLDAEEVRVEANRIDALRIDFQAKAEVALLVLKEAVGIQPEETIRLRGSLDETARSFDQNQLLQLASAHRPDLAVQRANEALATADLRQQHAEGKPDAAFSASYERPNSGFAQRAFDAAGNLDFRTRD